jgi:hypothetical protein
MKNYECTTNINHITIQHKKQQKDYHDIISCRFNFTIIDVLIIEKFWRNVCVLTSYNSFNIDIHLTYRCENDVQTCFYINTKFDVNKWSMNFSFENVCTLKLQIIDERIINIHNVYNSSFVFYTFRIVLTALKTMKNNLINDEKHILLNNFNLYHFMWEEVFKSTQHDATNQFINVVLQIRMQFTLSMSTVIWKARHLNNTINLVFMISWLVKSVINCETRSENFVHRINALVNEFVSSLRRAELLFALFQNCTHYRSQETQQKRLFWR